MAIGARRGRARLESAALARPAALAAAAPLLAASLVLYAMGGRLQFRITRADLERALDRTLTTDHFVAALRARERRRAPTWR